MTTVENANVRAVGDEAVGHLQDLLRIDTTNPPGNETRAAEYIAGVLRSEGYEPTIVESEPGRGSVVARYEGTGEREPLLLYGHVDVVTTEPSHWVRSPFSGEIAEGCVWGRGALDMKGLVAQELMIMLMLRRAGVRLRRDVIFAATADEEVGGNAGMGYLVDYHPHLIRAEYGLSEGGGTTMYIGGRAVYDVRTAEKGTCRFKLRAFGNPGHGSIPRPETAVTKAARAAQRLSSGSLAFHWTPTVAATFEAWCEALGVPRDGRRLTERNLERVMHLLPPELGRYLHAITHDTAVPTGLHAGEKINVIPSEAEVWVDGRYLPGQTTEAFLRDVTAVVGDGFQTDVVDTTVPLEEPPQGPLYDTIVSVMRRHAPQATVAPVMLSGATDAKHVARLGTKCLGFGPLKVSQEFPVHHMIHGHNERMPIEGYVWGLEVLHDIVTQFCSI